MDETIYGYWLPPDISQHGAQIDSLMNTVHWFMAVLFVGWGIFFLWCLVKFRARPGHTASYSPVKATFSKYIEAGVVVFEAFLLFGLSAPIWAKYKNDPPKESEALNVHVVAEQFAWNFHYAGKDGKFGRTALEFIAADNPLGIDPNDPDGKDDVYTTNEFHMPVDKPVITTLSSKDVIHSWNIPVLRVKQDTVPGIRIPVWFTATKTGKYDIACAQLCGLGHFRMRGEVTIETPAQFEAFLKERGPQPPAPPQAQQAPAPTPAQPPANAPPPEKKVTGNPPPQH
jgi:cytochrome c oxidase subunit 2